MLKEIVSRRLPALFHVPNGLHARHITPCIAQLMKQAGFKTIRIGFETADPDIQNETGGKVNCTDMISAADALKSAGFSSQETGVYILAGLPRQEASSVYKSVRFVRELGLRPYITEYSPIPGTALWNTAVSCSPYPIGSEPLFHNNTLLPCQWEKFTLDDLQTLKNISRREYVTGTP